MAETSFWAIEHALEHQRLGSLQIRVAAICGLIQMCDGYDVGSIGWSVPSLTHAWHIAPPAFAVAFLWSSIGIMAGALLAGPIGDRFGRKPLLMISVTLFGIASLASAVSPSLGFPGGNPLFHRRRHCRRICRNRGADRRLHAAAAARDDDHADLHRGAARQLRRRPGRVPAAARGFGWQMIFVIGGVFPLVLLAITALWLPESPRLLAARANLAPRHHALAAAACHRAVARRRAYDRRRPRQPDPAAVRPKVTRCKRPCCGSSSFAACWTCSCSSSGCRKCCT